MLFSEQELSVEVADFDIIIISHVDFSISWGRDAHQGEHFDKLAAQSTSADNERAWVLALFDEFVSEMHSVIVVSILLVDGLLSAISWKYFEEFVMKPLSQRAVLSSKFDDLLSYDTAPERAVGRNLGLSVSGNVFNEALINLFDFEVFPFNLHFFIFVVIDELN